MTHRPCRILQVFTLLLCRRYVTMADIECELGIDRRNARRILQRIRQEWELEVERNAVPSRGAGQTAYFFKPTYKQGLICPSSENEPVL